MKKFLLSFIVAHLCFAFMTSAHIGKRGDKSFTLSCLVPLQTVEIMPIPLPYLQYRWMIDDRAELGISNFLIFPEFDMTTCLVKNSTGNVALSLGAWIGLDGLGFRLLFNCGIFNCGFDTPHLFGFIPLTTYAGMKIPFNKHFSLMTKVMGLYTFTNLPIIHDLNYRWRALGNFGLQISW